MTFPARLVSFMVGLLSLSSETLWVRTYGFANESTPLSLSVVLSVYLLGIATGALYGGRLCREGGDLVAAAASRILTAALIVAATPFLIAVLPRSNALLIMLMFLPAFLFSICFPICHHIGTELGTGNVGRSLSKVYASNILGSVTGPLLINFVVMQWATTQLAFACIGAAGIATAVALVLANNSLETLRRHAAVAGIAGLAAIVATAATSNWLIAALSVERTDIRHIVETRQGIVVTTRNDQIGDAVFGGNVYDGRTNVDPRINSNGINRILVLAALNPRPKRVLVIGLSVGSWQYLIGGFPGVEHMDVIEINPGYMDLIQNYAPQQRAVADPRVKLFLGDGRKFLRQNPDAKYDLVVMNTTWHWRAYVSLLLSGEFLTLIKNHMTDDAVLAFNTTGSPDALKTAATVFPHAYLYGSFTIAGRRDWRQQLRHPDAVGHLMAIRPEGKPLFTDADRDLIAGFLSLDHTKDLAAVETKAGRRAEVITDRNLITEYKYGRR
ncbi:MAG: hypothetical protein ACKVP7_18260 [Hyphomicrobiaceae bacterium]